MCQFLIRTLSPCSLFFLPSRLSLFLVFRSLTMMGLSVNFFASILLRVLSALWICRFIFFPKLGNFEILFFQMVFSPFFFLPSSWDSSDMNVISFVIVPYVPEALFIFFQFSLCNFYCYTFKFIYSLICLWEFVTGQDRPGPGRGGYRQRMWKQRQDGFRWWW